MIDINTRVKNRIHATHDLHTLWQKLRNEGWQVWEDEDYADNEQAPEYGIKQPQKVVGVWYKGERIYNNERSK